MSDAASVPAKFEIAEQTYGGATTEVQRIIDAAAAIRWFPAVPADGSEIDAVRALLLEHLRLLGEREPRVDAALSMKFITGGWDVLGDAYRRVNPASIEADAAYARGSWRRAVGELAADIHRELQCSRPSLVVPPLFPFAGNQAIVGGMLTTNASRGSQIVDDAKWRETIWYLMCDVDSDFWNAITAALVSDHPRTPNAFRILVEIYTRGFYPLGFEEDQFIIYSRS